MKKKIDAYSETLYHLINFRIEQFKQSKNMIGIDYDAFMILQVIGAHYLKNNTKEASSWDAVWEQARSTKVEILYSKKKLTIFAVASILEIPRETVRRKIEYLKKKKLINHSAKLGLLPHEKAEIIMKPFAANELNSLSKFLIQLKNHKTLDQILNLKD